MNFHKKLEHSWATTNSLLCLGVDPMNTRGTRTEFKNAVQMQHTYCELIDETAQYLCAVKFQAAHFSAKGWETELAALIRHVRNQHPQLVVILDAKRGDIGSTAERYKQEAFSRYQVDAVTLNPYLGSDSVKPFFEDSTKGAIIVCRSSNPDADEIQEIKIENGHGQSLYEYIAQKTAEHWNNNNAMLVVGATVPEAISKVRNRYPEIPLLVPGVGAQGGGLESVLRLGLNKNGTGLIIPMSRAIYDASSPKLEAKRLCEQINRFRNTVAMT